MQLRRVIPAGLVDRAPRAAPARSLLRRVRRTAPRRPWVAHEVNPASPEPLASFRFYAVLSTWMEADIVDAAVANAFAQGCERVYLVDNASPDDTVAVAEAAGATVWSVFHTPAYDEARKMAIMHDLVRTVSRAAAEPVWWLWLDADEFHHGPHGRTVREHLATLDARFRVVGSRYLNHFPSEAPYAVSGRHPLDRQPLAEELSWNNCALGHRKHTLQLAVPGAPEIVCGAGFHVAPAAGITLLEPTEPVFVHHFPFREEERSRRRLDLLCGRRPGGERAVDGDIATIHMRNRFRTLDAVYRQDWANVENFWPGRPTHGVALRPWTEIVEAEHHRVARWYATHDVDQRVPS